MNVFDAVYTNNVSALRKYLSNGDINVKNERGMSLLHYAIVFNYTEIFNLLLENFIDVNLQDNRGDSALHYCVIHNKVGYLKTLIRNNASLGIKNNDGQTPLFKACSLGREEIVYLLLESNNFDLYERDTKEETVFMALVRSRNLDLLNRLILDDKIIDCKNVAKETPLHIACRSGDVKIVRYLLEHNAFVNSKNSTKETPLFYAVAKQNLEVIDLLLEYGAVLDCKSTFGDTIYNLIPTYDLSSYINEKSEKYKSYLYYSNYPLHYAIVIESYELVKRFLEIRNINRKDKFGYTPLELARRIENERILNLLLEYKA